MGMLDQLKWLGGYTSEPEIDDSSACALQAAARDLQQISTDIVQDAASRKLRARLAAIEGLAVGEAHDEFLDKATRLVGTSLHAPISMVNLIGETQQISASVLGDLPRTLPLSHSTCRLVVEHELPLMITDARNDDRVKDLPQVTDMGLQAYLGFPITMQEGVCVGSVCAIDVEPHVWSQRDQEVLCGVRDMVTMLLEMKREINSMESRMRMQQIQSIARGEKSIDS